MDKEPMDNVIPLNPQATLRHVSGLAEGLAAMTDEVLQRCGIGGCGNPNCEEEHPGEDLAEMIRKETAEIGSAEYHPLTHMIVAVFKSIAGGIPAESVAAVCAMICTTIQLAPDNQEPANDP